MRLSVHLSMPDSAATYAASSRRPSLLTTRPSVATSRRTSISTAADSPSHSGHSTHRPVPALSRRSSISLTATGSTASTARSRSHSISKGQPQLSSTTTSKPVHQPAYVHFIDAYNPSQQPHDGSGASGQQSSPFLSSPLYTLTPHETSLLFQHYTTPPTTTHITTSQPLPPVHTLTRDEFTALVIDWLQQLKRKSNDSTRELSIVGQHNNNTTHIDRPLTAGVVLDGVIAAIDTAIADGSTVAEHLFGILDTNGNERIERDEFKLFLATIDTIVGGSIRAEWKKAIVVPRLRAIAAL